MSWTQWSGQSRVVYDSDGLSGFVTRQVSTKDRLLGWLDAKEMCEGGCQSLVPMRRMKAGRARRRLMSGMMVRALGTGRVPFCGG